MVSTRDDHDVVPGSHQSIVVVRGGDQNNRRAGVDCSVDLLLDSPDAADRAVASDRSGTGDSPAIGEVLFGQLVHDLEREHHPG